MSRKSFLILIPVLFLESKSVRRKHPFCNMLRSLEWVIGQPLPHSLPTWSATPIQGRTGVGAPPASVPSTPAPSAGTKVQPVDPDEDETIGDKDEGGANIRRGHGDDHGVEEEEDNYPEGEKDDEVESQYDGNYPQDEGNSEDENLLDSEEAYEDHPVQDDSSENIPSDNVPSEDSN